MKTTINALDSTVSISLFNKGQAGRIFDSVRKEGPKLVLKNNEPECVLIDPKEYIKMVDELEDMKLMEETARRLKHFNMSKAIPEEEVYRKLGITKEDIDKTEDVDIE